MLLLHLSVDLQSAIYLHSPISYANLGRTRELRCLLTIQNLCPRHLLLTYWSIFLSSLLLCSLLDRLNSPTVLPCLVTLLMILGNLNRAGHLSRPLTIRDLHPDLLS